MTCVMSTRSSPRAATSVATSVAHARSRSGVARAPAAPRSGRREARRRRPGERSFRRAGRRRVVSARTRVPARARRAEARRGSRPCRPPSRRRPMLDLAVLLGDRVRLAADGVGRVHPCGSPTLESRSREEHGLPLTRHVAKDAVDLWLESHVEHPVGLVQNEDSHTVEGDGLALRRSLRRPGVATRTCARRARSAWA